MQQAYGLYTHIQANRNRSAALIAGLFALVLVLVFASMLLTESFSAEPTSVGLFQSAWHDTLYISPAAFAATLAWVLIAYKFHQLMIDTIVKGRVIDRRDEPWLYNLLETLCVSRGIAMPTLRMIDEPSLNAFATGLNSSQYSITVTSGLAQQLTDAEMEAVLAHELTHIRNGDVRLMVIAVVIAGAIGFFAESMLRGQAWSRGGTGTRTQSSSAGQSKNAGWAIVAALALVAIAWVLSIAIRFALSRRREFLADAGAVELTKNPDAMISALRKIEGRGELSNAPSAVMEMCVDNPRSGFADLFATHPSIDARVQALVNYSGGVDPGRITVAEPLDQPARDVPSSAAFAL